MPLLISVGFLLLCAAMIALIYNSVPVCFGAVGAPTNMAFTTVRDAVISLGSEPDAWKMALAFWFAFPLAIDYMICVNNVVSACATTGTNGNEGKIIKTNLIPCICFCIIDGVMKIAIAMGANP